MLMHGCKGIVGVVDEDMPIVFLSIPVQLDTGRGEFMRWREEWISVFNRLTAKWH